MKPSELLERPATPWTHHSVLLPEAVQALVHKPQGHYIDATFGRGGHSRAILACLAPEGRLTALDQDPEAVGAAQAMPDLMADPRFAIHHCNFSLLAEGTVAAHLKAATSSPDGTAFLAQMHLPKGGVDGLLLDLGISSPQIDQAERGLSFRLDGPLDMRMDSTRGTPVWQWLAQASVGSIAQVLRDFGQERFAAPIARAVVAQRESQGPLTRTLELAALVSRCIPRYEKGQHPATRTFQALRIFINQELEALEAVLQASLRLLQPQGRLVAISFHSLEDRRVKQFIAQHSRQTTHPRAPFLGPDDGLGALHLRALGRVKPSTEEVARNPRARSALMRVAERTAQAL